MAPDNFVRKTANTQHRLTIARLVPSFTGLSDSVDKSLIQPSVFEWAAGYGDLKRATISPRQARAIVNGQGSLSNRSCAAWILGEGLFLKGHKQPKG